MPPGEICPKEKGLYQGKSPFNLRGHNLAWISKERGRKAPFGGAGGESGQEGFHKRKEDAETPSKERETRKKKGNHHLHQAAP